MKSPTRRRLEMACLLGGAILIWMTLFATLASAVFLAVHLNRHIAPSYTDPAGNVCPDDQTKGGYCR